jgi:hypothetical protein
MVIISILLPFYGDNLDSSPSLGLCLTDQGGQMYLGSDAEHMISTFTNATQDSAGIGWTPRKLGVGFYGVTVEDIKAFYGVSPPRYHIRLAITPPMIATQPFR